MTTKIPSPLFSIITVTFNAERTLGATMESVGCQTFRDYEHIIMDGCSTDGTLAIAEHLGTPATRVFSSPDHGIYDAMNKAMGKARGKYLVFLNAGDHFYDADTLARMAEAADGADIVYGQTVLVDANDTILGPRHLTAPATLDASSFKNGMLVCHQAFAPRRAIAPLYNTEFKFSADYEWCIRCLQLSRHNAYAGDHPLIRYLSEGMTTRNHRASLAERFRIMSRYYGFWPTLGRHLSFVKRYVSRRRTAPNKQ